MVPDARAVVCFHGRSIVCFVFLVCPYLILYRIREPSEKISGKNCKCKRSVQLQSGCHLHEAPGPEIGLLIGKCQQRGRTQHSLCKTGRVTRPALLGCRALAGEDQVRVSCGCHCGLPVNRHAYRQRLLLTVANLNRDGKPVCSVYRQRVNQKERGQRGLLVIQ